MQALLEVCAGSLASCLAAQAGGAGRVELCDNLLEGGTTPSFGQIALARERLDIALHVIIRPRGGDFCYDDAEFDVMARDVELCRRLDADGVVLGVLTPDGDVDVARTRALVELAGPLPVTFHRAFDVARQPLRALDDVIASGCVRLPSSGQQARALDGAAPLASLRQAAGERLVVMPGGGVRAEHAALLRRLTGCREFHASCRVAQDGPMRHRPPQPRFAAPGQGEHDRVETDAARVAELLAALASVSPAPCSA